MKHLSGTLCALRKRFAFAVEDIEMCDGGGCYLASGMVELSVGQREKQRGRREKTEGGRVVEGKRRKRLLQL